MSMVADDELVQRAIAGDETAFESLYDRYAKLVRLVCYETTRDVGVAQDLAQEVFLRAFVKLADIENADRFGSWLAGIAKLVSLEWIRKKGRDKHQFDEDLHSKVAAYEPDEDERIAIMHDAMNDLGEDERFALHAVYLQGQSAKAARKVLDLSQSGFYKLLDRARGKLERAISLRSMDR